jgi:hypothetical protein
LAVPAFLPVLLGTATTVSATGSVSLDAVVVQGSPQPLS